MEDSLGDRTWIENEKCRTFVENLLTAFDTKLPPRSVAHSAGDGTKESSEGFGFSKIVFVFHSFLLHCKSSSNPGISYTVKNTALNAVFQVTSRLQFLNFGVPEKTYIINIQSNLFSLNLTMDQYRNCVFNRRESGNIMVSIFV